jgi:hypothetical protein
MNQVAPEASGAKQEVSTPGRAAFAFIFITVLLDMMAIGIAALSVLGRSEEAHTAAAALTRLQPDLSVDYIDTTYPFQMAEDRSRFIEALRSAGLLSS